MNINLSNKNAADIQQKFSFFTEENWKTEKQNFNNNLESIFEAKKNETFVIASENEIQYLIGLGNQPENFDLQEVASKFSYNNRKKIKAAATLINSESFNKNQIENLVKGLFLGTYTYPFKAEHPLFENNFSLIINGISDEELSDIQLKTIAICEGQFACMEWLNKPQNFKRVSHISEFLNEISEKYNLKQTVFDRKKSEELGLGAFLSVNQGSSQEAAFTILEYNSGVENAKTVGLVGKCVLFDTGGISIKGSENLH